MRTQHSRKRTPKKVSSRSARRPRPAPTKDIERLCNRAVRKFWGVMRRQPRRTYEAARMIGAQILRSTARRHMFAPGTDEYDYFDACLREKAEEYRS